MNHLLRLTIAWFCTYPCYGQETAPIQQPIVPLSLGTETTSSILTAAVPEALALPQAESARVQSKTSETPVIHYQKNPDNKKVDYTKTFTLQHPFNRALIAAFNTNPELRSKVKDTYARTEEIAKVMADWRPDIRLQGTFGRSWVDSEVPLGSRGGLWTSPSTASAAIRQNLYRGGQTTAKIEQTKAGIYAAFADLANTEQKILLSAVNAYLDLWAKQNVLKLNQNNVVVKQRTLNQAQARYEVGEITMTDVAQAQSEMAASTAQMVGTQADVVTATETYIQIIGEMPHDVTAPPALKNIRTMPVTRDEAQQRAIKNHPSIRQAQFSKKSSYAAIDAAESARLPIVDFTVNAGRSLQGSSKESRQNNATALLTLTVPLYQQGNEWADIRQTTQSAARSKIDLVTAQRQVIQYAMQSWEQWKSYESQIDQIKIQIQSATISLEGVRQENLVGERTLLDVLTAENVLLQAQTNLVNTEQKYLLAGYQLLTSLGELMAVDMGLPVDPYPVHENYERVKHQLGGRSDYPLN